MREYSQWHRFIPDNAFAFRGHIIDAMQRYLQFDTFGGIIPAKAIDLLYAENDLRLLAEQATVFHAEHADALSRLPASAQEEVIRAHLCGLLKDPAADTDWRDGLTRRHEKNKKLYAESTTTGRLNMLLDRHPEADVLVTAVHMYQEEYAPEYTAADLIGWAIDAKRFYRENADRLGRLKPKAQCDVIGRFLAGKLDTAW